jgi:hypothetical protein
MLLTDVRFAGVSAAHALLPRREGRNGRGRVPTESLLDLASALSEELDAAYPGFSEAMHFPEKPHGEKDRGE